LSVGERFGESMERVRNLGPLLAAAMRWMWRASLATGAAVFLVWGVRAYRASSVSAPVEQKAVVPEKKPAAAVAAASASKATGRLHVDSEPSGAKVLLDGKDRGETPLEIDDLAIGKHTLVLRGSAGTIERAVTVAADRTTEIKEAIYSGWLHVSAPIELQIADGGRRVRLDDRSQALLGAGAHTITLSNRALRFEETRSVHVKPGDTVSLTIEPQPAPLTVTASEPAQVSIDGDLIGDAPLTDHPTKIGTREVVVRGASGATRRATITVTTEGARVDVDFSKP
jgi:hypothetical protein